MYVPACFLSVSSFTCRISASLVFSDVMSSNDLLEKIMGQAVKLTKFKGTIILENLQHGVARCGTLMIKPVIMQGTYFSL